MTMFKSEFLQECEARGLIFQCTNIEELDRRLAGGERLVAYWGTDPTGASMHVGHLFSLMLMRLFQKYGNKPIILLGGATALIGDPTGKDASRPMLTNELLERNKKGIKKAIKKFLKFGEGENDAILVDNYDWWRDVNYMDMLRNIAPYISVNRMLSFESVKQRLARESHLSFLEFNYMIFQSYDFYYLHKNYNCNIQLCGADQWGNVVSGVDLVNKLNTVHNESKIEAIGLSTPLLLDNNGKKVGKSEGNAIWVDEDLLEPYDYFQYFRNIDDRDVEKFMLAYTELPVSKIKEIASGDINEAKKILAFEATKLCHGEDNANQALQQAKSIFEDNSKNALPIIKYSIEDGEKSIFQLIKKLGLTSSGSEAKKLIRGGGVKIDDKKIEDENLDISGMREFKLSLGKKKHFLILVE